jgi:DnaJ like chaperone protein
MANWNKFLFGGLGWALGGPIGGVLGLIIGSVVDHESQVRTGVQNTQAATQPGDFSVALLILCGAVMKSDNKILKSELDFVKDFFVKQFGVVAAQEKMLLFREILKQEYSLSEVCGQIKYNLDYPSKLQLIHLLYGLSGADGEFHKNEIEIIYTISSFLGITEKDYISIKAMFIKDTTSAYKILEIEPFATDEDVKKAYRQMAVKYHPDKVFHLGPEIQASAQEKFKMINEAYDQIKKERGMN